jgi:hypothetical protein
MGGGGNFAPMLLPCLDLFAYLVFKNAQNSIHYTHMTLQPTTTSRGWLLMSVEGRVYFCKKFKMWYYLHFFIYHRLI